MTTTAQTALPLDDNLYNGVTYTFQFQLDNWLFSPDETTVLNDIGMNAPDFLTSVIVTFANGLTKYYMNVQFTYEGDGSDVVSDLANSLVAAFKAGSNDNFIFVQAFSASSVDVPSAPDSQTVPTPGSVLTQVGTSVGDTAGKITSGALGGVTQGLGAWFIPVVLVLAIVLIFQLGGVGGFKRSLQGA